MTTLDFDDFDVLTFDCYGTLIDWETGLLAAFREPLANHGVSESDDDVLGAFARHEAKLEAGPYRRYRDVLGTVLKEMLGHFGQDATPEEIATFGGSVADWPAFADSTAALARQDGEHPATGHRVPEIRERLEASLNEALPREG